MEKRPALRGEAEIVIVVWDADHEFDEAVKIKGKALYIDLDGAAQLRQEAMPGYSNTTVVCQPLTVAAGKSLCIHGFTRHEFLSSVLVPAQMKLRAVASFAQSRLCCGEQHTLILRPHQFDGTHLKERLAIEQ